MRMKFWFSPMEVRHALQDRLADQVVGIDTIPPEDFTFEFVIVDGADGEAGSAILTWDEGAAAERCDAEAPTKG